MLTVVPQEFEGGDRAAGSTGSESLIDELVREGARRMLVAALRAEVDAYVAQFREERDEDGRRLVVRNGYHQAREIVTGAGVVEVSAPRVNDRRTDPDTGERRRFSSVILPAWCRRTPKVTEVLPLLYLHGLSTSDFVPALGQPGSRAAGLAMAFKLIEAAQDRWRAVNAPHLVSLVRVGAVSKDGKLVKRPDEHLQPEAA